MAEFAVDPIFGVQVYARLLPMLSVPNAEVAEAMISKYGTNATALDQLTEQYREGIA